MYLFADLPVPLSTILFYTLLTLLIRQNKMSFLNNLANQFMHQGGSGQHQQQEQQGYGNQGYPPQGGYGGQQYGGQQHPQNDGRPHPPAPWIAEWDNYENRWVYINRENGQRTHEFPQQGYGGGYQQQSYQQGGYSGGYGGQPQQQMQEQHKSHNGRNMAFGAIAGVAGGALLMHEGEKVHEDWDKDKYRAEERFDDARYDVDYDARRAGNYVEGIPDRVAYDVGRDEQRIEE